MTHAIVSEIAGDNTIVRTENNFIASTLINLGFVFNKYGYLEKKNFNQDIRLSNIEELIGLDALFSAGKDWSPEDLLAYYKELGLFNKPYKVISWRGEADFLIRIIE